MFLCTVHRSLAVSHVWWAAGVVLWTQGSTLHALAHRRAEGGRVLGGMMLRRRRMRGCKRELMCRRRAQTMRRRAVHAALHRTSIGRTEAAAGRPGGPWKLLRRDERRLRRVGRVAGRDPGIGWLPRRRRPRPALEAQGCANFETGVCVVKGTASPRDWVYIEYSFLIRLLRAVKKK